MNLLAHDHNDSTASRHKCEDVLFVVKKHQRGPGPQEVLYLHRRGGRGNLIDGLFMRGGRNSRKRGKGESQPLVD